MRIDTSTIETASSATMNRGCNGQRAGNRDALALSAAEARADTCKNSRRGQVDQMQQLEHARDGAAARIASGGAREWRAERVEHGAHGFSDAYGSWCTSWTARRNAASRLPFGCPHIAALEAQVSTRRAQQPGQHFPGGRLAAAALADEARISPAPSASETRRPP